MDKAPATQSPAADVWVSHNGGNISSINDYDYHYTRYNDHTA
jgi:hypothetical protein